MAERDFKGIFIPSKIVNDKFLNWNEKIYLSLANAGYSPKEIEDIMLYSMSSHTIRKCKYSLSYKGYIDFKTPSVVKQIVIEHRNDGYVCEWCGQKSYLLHKHHYPIPKSKGGVKTVNICPNCHCAYHQIIGG